MHNLFGEANSLFGGVTNDVGKLLGTLAVRSKRGLLDDAVYIGSADDFLNPVIQDAKDKNVNKIIDDAYKTVWLHQ